MHAELRFLKHRPWPVSERKWRWSQLWTDLIFLHWECTPETLVARLPESVELDLFEGTAWIGVVPFDSKRFTQRPLPSLPDAFHLPEMNVRTYVTVGGKPGVWFFSLDISSCLAVIAARAYFHLPYFRARMTIEVDDDGIRFQAKRSHASSKQQFDAHFVRSTRSALKPDAFHQWATERYCLYAEDSRHRLYRTEIHHRPWCLEGATVDLHTNTYLDDFECGSLSPCVLFSKRQETLFWPPECIRERR